MNVLIFSNSIQGRYGYSNVFGEVAKGLAKAGNNVCYFGMQDLSPPWKDENGIVRLGLRYDSFGSDILENIVRAYKIDVLLTGMDVWLEQVQYIPGLCKKYNIPLISHITVNSYPLSPFLARFCVNANVLVAPSKFVESTLKEVFPEKTFRISHGVDTSLYKPISKKEKEKFKEKLRVEDKEFILGTVMRNKSPYQKNFPVLFRAWKALLNEYEELKKEGILLCLTDPFEINSLRIDLLRERTGLNDVVKFVWGKPSEDLSRLEMTYENDPRGFPHNANYSFCAEEMVRFYNILDAHIICSYGESFNLPTLESMACGIPQINAEHTTGFELVGEPKTGLLAKIKSEISMPLISDQWLVDYQSLAECMEKIYLNKKLRKRFSENAIKFAKERDWKNIIPEWVELVDVIQYLG